MQAKLKFGFIKILNFALNKISQQNFVGPVSDIHEFYSESGLYEDINHIKSVRKNNIKNHGNFNLSIRQILLSLYCQRRKYPFRILDIGGGSSSIYQNLKYLNIEAEVIVLETDLFVDHIGRDYLNKLPYQIIKNEELKDYSFDLCYFGSSIQYFYDENTLRSIVHDSGASSVIIAGSVINLLNDDSSIYGQPKVRGGLQPYKIWSLSRLTSIFNDIGLNLIVNVPEEKMPISLPNIVSPVFTRFLTYEVPDMEL